jgi:hypothetical protein
MIIDTPSEGAPAISVLPVFDGDRRQTILYLQHVMGAAALKRLYERSFEMLSQREHALDKIEKVCRREEGYTDALNRRFADSS